MEVVVEAPYEFLKDISGGQPAKFKSPLRNSVINAFSATLQTYDEMLLISFKVLRFIKRIDI